MFWHLLPLYLKFLLIKYWIEFKFFLFLSSIWWEFRRYFLSFLLSMAITKSISPLLHQMKGWKENYAHSRKGKRKEEEMERKCEKESSDGYGYDLPSDELAAARLGRRLKTHIKKIWTTNSGLLIDNDSSFVSNSRFKSFLSCFYDKKRKGNSRIQMVNKKISVLDGNFSWPFVVIDDGFASLLLYSMCIWSGFPSVWTFDLELWWLNSDNSIRTRVKVLLW